MYALGGNTGPVSINTCEVYDPHLDKWTFIASMNKCRAGAGAVVVDGFIYVIGMIFFMTILWLRKHQF